MKKTVHIGFKGAEAKVQKEGYSKQSAAKIVASASRKAKKAGSPNKRLRRVKG